MEVQLKLISKIAWSFNKTTGIDYEELFSEASLAYCEGLSRFDPTKGTKLTTFLYLYMQCHLKNYLQKHHVKQPNLVRIDDYRIERTVDASFFFESCTDDAREIAETVLNGVRPFLALSQKNAYERIAKVMQNKGWDMPKIWTGIKELRYALN